MTNERIIAVFDYDNTLVKGDSLWPFLVAVAGRVKAYRTLLKALIGWPIIWLRGGDTRTHVKAVLLQDLLGGKKLADLSFAVEAMRMWPKEKEPAMSTIKDHRAKGHHILIASGSLDLYLPALLEKAPYDALLCTRMEVVDGVVTGRMLSGNCVRTLKAKKVAEYLKTNGPFDDSWGYGNAPHDLPMLENMGHKVII